MGTGYENFLIVDRDSSLTLLGRKNLFISLEKLIILNKFKHANNVSAIMI
jgi:hypothetical protein